MPYVVQMHGEPGSGKTTLARAIARALPGVALQLDVTADALIRSGVDPGTDGVVTYEVHYAFAENPLSMGHNVILDNPVFRPAVEVRSRSLARTGEWRMIETVCSDENVRQQGLKDRSALPLQAKNLSDWRVKPGTSEPAALRLVIDTRASLRECLHLAIRYISRNGSSDG